MRKARPGPGWSLIQGPDQQAALQVGFGPGREPGCEAKVTAEAHVELVAFAAIRFEYAGDKNDFAEHDGVTLQFVDA